MNRRLPLGSPKHIIYGVSVRSTLSVLTDQRLKGRSVMGICRVAAGNAVSCTAHVLG